jgi:cytochrome c biogenesis protein CcdA
MIGQGNYALALTAGIFATFNPCGFAMLPAYLSFIIIGSEKDKSKTASLKDAFKFSFFMGLGILAVFALFAAVVIPFESSIQKYLPIFTLVIGACLVLGGAVILSGRAITFAKIWSPSISPTGKTLTFLGYGATFALGSISCTIGPFLAITNSAIATSNALRILLTYFFFGLGISTTIAVLAVLTATSHQFVTSKLRRASYWISVFTSVILIAVGLYLLYFAWYEIRLSAGDNSRDLITSAAFRAQGWIINLVTHLLRLVHLYA